MSTIKLPPPVIVCARVPEHAGPGATTLLEVAGSKESPLQRALQLQQTQDASTAGAVAPGEDAAPPPVPVPSPASSAAAGEATPPSRSPRPDTALFRHEALRAYQLGFQLSTPLKVVPLSTRLVLISLGLLLLSGLGVASFGYIDLTARGRGVLRTSEGVQPLMLEIEGVVSEVPVHEGDTVQVGQLLLRLDSTRLSSALREAEAQLSAIDERARQDGALAQITYTRDRSLLERRAHLTRARIESQERSVAALDVERARYERLAGEGLVADKATRESEASLRNERRGLLALQDDHARIEQQLAALEQTYRTGMTLRAHEVRDATSRRDAAARLLTQTELHATRAGRIESLVVGPGDVVTAGRVVARLVPLAAGRQVTAFVPERERAFVRMGASVRVEFDQLPVGEFGSAAAHVLRVSSDVASPPEVEKTLGAAAPEGVHFAVALELEDDRATRTLLAQVGSGTLLTVRLPVRRRRLITLVFDPVRRWLD